MPINAPNHWILLPADVKKRTVALLDSADYVSLDNDYDTYIHRRST